MCVIHARTKGTVYIPYRYGKSMFSTERSDFGSTIAGYFLAAVVFLFGGLLLLNMQFDIFSNVSTMPFQFLALLLVCAGAIALWKAYIIDGITFMIAGLISYAFIAGDVPMFLIALAFAALATGFMAYRVGDVFVLLLNVCVAISSIIGALSSGIDFFVDNPIVSGIFLIVAAGLAGYLCLSDWMLVQDIAMDYEDEMFDDCCCDDDCDCGDDCECHCHDEECQSEEKE